VGSESQREKRKSKRKGVGLVGSKCWAGRSEFAPGLKLEGGPTDFFRSPQAQVRC
jgi:hypothetical protein